MIEPIWVGPHRGLAYRPELEAKQMIFKCRDNDLGLSVITAKGDRFGDEKTLGHGLYCSDEQPYEAILIYRIVQTENDRYDFELFPGVEPYGWLTIEALGTLLDAVCEKGVEGYDNWRYPYRDDDFGLDTADEMIHTP